MGNLRVDLTNFVTVGLIAFVAVFAINRLLKMSGFDQYTA